MADSYLFTVFTATYNRAHTIHRVFDSLCAQTLRDFEWIVVDDGSNDNTAALIEGWAKKADFPVRCFRQNHSGKHVAYNLAVREARGLFFAPLDSDDAFLPDSLERIIIHWNSIPEVEREVFSGVGGLCCDQYDVLIGDRFPTSPFDSNFGDMIYRHRIRGEKWGITRTDLVRRYPFPEVPGTQFVPEGLIGLQMARYKRRYINEVFRIYYRNEYKEPGKNLSHRASLVSNAAGRLPYYIWLLDKEIGYFWHSPVPFLKAAVMLPLAAQASGQSLRQALQSVRGLAARLLIVLMLPVTLMLRSSEEALIRCKRRGNGRVHDASNNDD